MGRHATPLWPDTLSWFRTNQSLLLLLNAACCKKYQYYKYLVGHVQIPLKYSCISIEIGLNIHKVFSIYLLQYTGTYSSILCHQYLYWIITMKTHRWCDDSCAGLRLGWAQLDVSNQILIILVFFAACSIKEIFWSVYPENFIGSLISMRLVSIICFILIVSNNHIIDIWHTSCNQLLKCKG
jgi:hypothetical protein